MNTDKSLRRFRLCLCALVLALAGCNGQEWENMGEPGNETATFSFSVQDIQTRVNYDFEHSSFDGGDLVGCVIAEVNADGTYTYLRNSAWEYQNGMLVFQYYWGWKMGTNQYGGQEVMYSKIYPNDTEYQDQNGQTVVPNKIIAPDTGKGEEYLTSPYLTANPGKELKFFFYYPYVDNELLTQNYTSIISSAESDKYKLIAYPNCATATTSIPITDDSKDWNGITLTGEVAASEENHQYTAAGLFHRYGWQAYPCFVNHTQGDVNAAGQTNDQRLQNSDFLWTASPKINVKSQSRISLLFKKKTATILVYSETKLDDIYFKANGEQTLIRGKQINLTTGDLNNYTYSTDWNNFPQQANMYFKADEHIIPRYRGQDIAEGSNYYFYRLVLPAQEECSFKMHFEIAEGDIKQDIDLSADDHLSALKEGYLYSIRISKDGKTVIRINDWKDDGSSDLEEVTQP